MPDATQRFTDRVDNYVRYRPSYPPVVLETLASQCGLTAKSVVADVGSGTGILSRLFLENGNQVFGIEPNREMRLAGERFLASYERFISLAARAEATSLPDASVDFVTAGQAFHWFDHQAASREFTRILKPQGWVALVWNARDRQVTPFMVAYEQLLLRYGIDYAQVSHQDFDPADMEKLFHAGVEVFTFESPRIVDHDTLRGRLLSSSYAPLAGHPDHEPMLQALQAIFDAHQVEGTVSYLYTTTLYLCQPTPLLAGGA